MRDEVPGLQKGLSTADKKSRFSCGSAERYFGYIYTHIGK